MSQQTLHERLVDVAFPGSRLVSTEPLTGGVSAEMHALVVETTAGAQREVVLRVQSDADWKANEASVSAKEFALLQALGTRGFAVPEPLFLDESGDLLPRPFYVMTRVPGTTTVSKEHLDGALEEMARFLARLHRLDTSSLPELPFLEDPRAEVFQYLSDDALETRVRAALKRRAPGPTQRSLIHGDYWPGNVLWRGAQLAAVIDWEDAAMGDPLADLAAARVELLCRYDDKAMDLFTEKYLAETKVDLTDLPLWEVYVSSSALATMEHWGLPAEEEAARRLATDRFLRRAVADLETVEGVNKT